MSFPWQSHKLTEYRPSYRQNLKPYATLRSYPNSELSLKKNLILYLPRNKKSEQSPVNNFHPRLNTRKDYTQKILKKQANDSGAGTLPRMTPKNTNCNPQKRISFPRPGNTTSLKPKLPLIFS